MFQQNLKTTGTDVITIKDNRGIHFIEHQNIVFCRGEGRYTKITVNEGKEFLIVRVLKEFEDILPRSSFFRIHKSCIINVNCMKEFNYRSMSSVTMNNHATLKVAKRRKTEFLKFLDDFILV